MKWKELVGLSKVIDNKPRFTHFYFLLHTTTPPDRLRNPNLFSVRKSARLPLW
jgi:hypothetical protein